MTDLSPWIVSSTDGRGRNDGTWYIKTRFMGGWCYGSEGFATKAKAQAETKIKESLERSQAYDALTEDAYQAADMDFL